MTCIITATLHRSVIRNTFRETEYSKEKIQQNDKYINMEYTRVQRKHRKHRVYIEYSNRIHRVHKPYQQYSVLVEIFRPGVLQHIRINESSVLTNGPCQLHLPVRYSKCRKKEEGKKEVQGKRKFRL